MTNVLFIDVDGTLITSKDGKQYIPPSAIEALSEVRERGDRVYLCTGRSLAEANTIGDVPIDGIIGVAGGFAIDGETMVFHRVLGTSAVREAEDTLREYGATYYLECNSGLYFDDEFLAYVNEAWGITDDESWTGIIHTLEDVPRDEVNKINFRATVGDVYDKVDARLGDRFCIVRSSFDDPNISAGEISCFGINKATAIDELLAYLDLGDVRTYGFGDSMNDIEMLQRCDESIVMGDARHGVEQYATYVTKDLLDDGLAYAMRHFGLIV